MRKTILLMVATFVILGIASRGFGEKVFVDEFGLAELVDTREYYGSWEVVDAYTNISPDPAIWIISWTHIKEWKVGAVLKGFGLGYDSKTEETCTLQITVKPDYRAIFYERCNQVYYFYKIYKITLYQDSETGQSYEKREFVGTDWKKCIYNEKMVKSYKIEYGIESHLKVR